MSRIVSIVGARPQFIKLKPVHEAMKRKHVEHVILHTGQHYDANMSQNLFDQLHLPEPDIELGIAPDIPANQIAEMVPAIEEQVSRIRPDAALIYGDTTTTLAAAVALSKMHLRFGHVEAGMRSGQMEMLEEVSRRIADRVSSVLFAPTQTALSNLSREGLGHKALVVGDVMLDLFYSVQELVHGLNPENITGIKGDYALITLHRAENVDHPETLKQILQNLSSLSDTLEMVFPMHPRTRNRVEEFGLERYLAGMLVIPPQNYLETLALIARASVVITDSGGVQKEAFFSGVPCITMRDNTEWPETLRAGANVLVPEARGIQKVVQDILSVSRVQWDISAFGHGAAGTKITEVLLGA